MATMKSTKPLVVICVMGKRVTAAYATQEIDVIALDYNVDADAADDYLNALFDEHEDIREVKIAYPA